MDEKTLKLRKAKPCAVCGGKPELVELNDNEHGHTYGLRCDSGHEHREPGGRVLTTGANFADLGKCVRRWNFLGRRWVGRAAEHSGARYKSRGKQLGAVNGWMAVLSSEEKRAVEELMQLQDLSSVGVLRCALRLYQARVKGMPDTPLVAELVQARPSNTRRTQQR